MVKSHDGRCRHEKASSITWMSPSPCVTRTSSPSVGATRPRSTRAGFAGLFKTTNAGQSWAKIDGLQYLSGLSIDPFDAGHLIAWGEETYQSKDAGASWTPMSGIEPGDAIAFDPSTPGRMYSHQYEVRRSDDGGAHWRPLAAASGNVDSWRFAIAPGGDVLYAGGFDSAVWTWSYGKQRAARH